MKQSTQLHKLATSLSLFVLALGFSVLGFAPLMFRFPTGALLSIENAGYFIGSAFSILVGLTFLFLAVYVTWLLRVRGLPSLPNSLSE